VRVFRLRRLPDRFHIVDGELPEPKIAANSRPRNCRPGREDWPRRENIRVSDRVGIPWLGWTCGRCNFCRSDRENLCRRARFTGYTIDGGYA